MSFFLKRFVSFLHDILTPDMTQEQLDAKLDKLAAESPVDLDTDQSIVDLLKATGKDSDFKSRMRLAENYGIVGYAGTAEQNIELHQLFVADLKKRKISLPKPGEA